VINRGISGDVAQRCQIIELINKSDGWLFNRRLSW